MYHHLKGVTSLLHTAPNLPLVGASFKEMVATQIFTSMDPVSMMMSLRKSNRYGDLTKSEELAKCLHGQTQNANESFNAMIWEPKANCCGLNILKLSIYDATASFNYGGKGDQYVLKEGKPYEEGKTYEAGGF